MKIKNTMLRSYSISARVIKDFESLTAIENAKKEHSRGLDAENSLSPWSFLTRELQSHETILCDQGAAKAQKLKLPDRIGITGAAGTIGTVLKESFKDKYKMFLYDKAPIFNISQGIESLAVDLTNQHIRGIFPNLDTLINLAADPSPFSPWESIKKNNLDLTLSVFEEAVRSGVKKIIFASSNHVQHGYMMGMTPEELDNEFYNKHRKITLRDPPKPDSLYAFSKLCGEALGRHYADLSSIQFIALRIGWVTPQDDPRVKKGTLSESYMRSVFLSKRDCAAAFTKAIESKEKYLVAYAMSNNDRCCYDLSETNQKLGFIPQDNAENYFKTDLLQEHL